MRLTPRPSRRYLRSRSRPPQHLRHHQRHHNPEAHLKKSIQRNPPVRSRTRHQQNNRRRHPRQPTGPLQTHQLWNHHANQHCNGIHDQMTMPHGRCSPSHQRPDRSTHQTVPRCRQRRRPLRLHHNNGSHARPIPLRKPKHPYKRQTKKCSGGSCKNNTSISSPARTTPPNALSPNVATLQQTPHTHQTMSSRP